MQECYEKIKENYRELRGIEDYCSVAFDLRSCHCESAEGGRGNLLYERLRLLRFARNDTHQLVCDRALLLYIGFTLPSNR